MRGFARKFRALVSARNKEFYRDHSTLGWTFLFPLIVLSGFAYGYSGKQDPVLRIVAHPAGAASLSGVVASLRDTPGAQFAAVDDAQGALRKLSRYEQDLYVSVSPDGSLSYSRIEDSDKGKLAERLLKDALARAPAPRPSLQLQPVEGHRIRYADWVLPGLLAMNIMFGSMFGVGYVIVRYRKNGVLKRLRATPLSAFQFLTAQVVSRMLLMVTSSVIVLAGSMLVIGFRPQGSWLATVVFLALSSTAMISVGLVVAARIASEEVADGVLNLMTWPMIFLSGIWFSLDGASLWVTRAAQLMPLTHVVHGLRGILIDGATLRDVMPEMIVLSCVTAVLIALGSIIFRWR
jgi:ABC-2 type transport system permease protein